MPNISISSELYEQLEAYCRQRSLPIERVAEVAVGEYMTRYEVSGDKLVQAHRNAQKRYRDQSKSLKVYLDNEFYEVVKGFAVGKKMSIRQLVLVAVKDHMGVGSGK